MSNEPKAGNSLDPEMLAAYIDKRLPPDERAGVEAKLAADPDSYELLVELIHAHEALKGETPADGDATDPADRAEPQARTGAVVPMVPKPKRTGGWMIAGGVLAAAAALALVVRLQPELWQRVRGGDAVDPQLARLVEAVGEERYIEARLTGGFNHGRLKSATRGPQASPSNLALLAAAGELQQRAQAESSAVNLQAWGLAAILVGQLDEAVRALQDAGRADSTNARIQTDLSAAYLARAQATGQAADLPRALASAERAVELDQDLLEARFNRALALELLHLTEQAEAAWQDYARRDTSAWGDEARARGSRPGASNADESWQTLLAAVEQQGNPADLVRQSPERSMKLGEAEWPAAWAASIATGDTGRANVVLTQLTALGVALESHLGDPMVANASTYLGGLAGRSRDEVAATLVDYARARQLAETYNFADAATLLSAVFDQMSAQRNPLATVALLEYAGALRSTRQIDKAHALLPSLMEQTARHRSVGARAYRLRGLLQVARGRYTDALGDYGLAIGLFKSAGLRLTEAQTATLIAEALRVVGSKELWNYQEQALQTAELGASPRELQPIFFTAGVTALTEDLPESARAFFTAMISAAEKVGTPAAIAEARLSRARAFLAMGADDELEADLAAANQLLDSGPTTVHGEFVRGEWTAVRAERLAASDSDEALRAAEQALDYAARTKRSSLMPRMRLAQGRALVKAARPAEAAAAFSAGIAAFESQWANVTQDALRITHFDRAWDLYGDLAILQAESGQSADALATLERSQARSVLAARNQSGPGWSRVRLETALRRGAAIIYWLPAEQTTYAWVVRPSGTRMVSVPVGRREIDQNKRSPRDLEQLGARLLQPLSPLLTDVTAIGFVAPGALSQIPWAAVRLADRPLVESATVQLLPNTLMALNSRRMVRAGEVNALVVAAGTDLVDGLERLADLPRARLEAVGVAAHYRRPTVLLDEQARSASVLAGLASHTIFHFAGHAIANEATPELSRLVLARGQTISGRDLAAVAKLGTRLAVLTACRTASGAVVRSEGSLSLARMLLARGVDEVIASLFPVTDAVGSRFGLLLHQSLAQGLPADVALSNAQRQLMREDVSGDHEWAFFVLAGGQGLFVEQGDTE